MNDKKNTTAGIICLAMICATLLAITWMLTN